MAKKRRGRRSGPTFMRLKLVSTGAAARITSAAVVEIIDAALTGTYGIIGGAVILYELVSFDEESGSAVIRYDASDEERLWAATSFVTPYKGVLYKLTVLESSPLLVSAGDLPQEMSD